MAGPNRRNPRGESASRGGRSTDGGESTNSGRRLVIKPLTTVGDRGKPTDHVAKDLQRVLNFIQDERHLVAYDLYLDCKGRLNKLREVGENYDEEKDAKAKKKRWGAAKKGSSGPSFDAEEYEAALDLVRKHREEFTVLEVSFQDRLGIRTRPTPIYSNDDQWSPP